MSDSNTFTITRQDRSKGGKARAANLTAEQRREIAIKANRSKKCYQGLPKATHSGDLSIGNISISCAVLEDGRRVITETSMFELLKRSRKGKRTRGTKLPAFISQSNLKPFISNEIEGGLIPFPYFHPKRGKVTGIDALMIPKICKVYLDAQLAGVLRETQLPTAFQAYIIQQALAETGIVSLVDEASGYQIQRENDELQKLFSKFISKELQPWTKRFPNEFFENIKRWYGLEHLKGNPSFIGCFINKFVYEEISPDILEELKKRNPMVEGGYRKNKHHQLLSTDIGHPTLEKQILKINTLMSASDSKEDFDELFKKLKR
jgi:hypothetical protein